ncbi:amino acid ABC transporter substrate-binding protein (PAAT family) [Actinoplanes lutulentus]|uniref:Amino acid ABC transporter substrate-binding protein (PAAT family) n=1 Tax=Actinoplanes lutulentus TaxID=1287878 RepID=A0A327YZH6_9ACTN|nr:transporter substrate-binding domain-containing protein [Actinoplanes lutulentus]RAK26493.1 amino acid ABC transporter substrate-binding protein (PAAT family) [Actinoplanes lutulentus]
MIIAAAAAASLLGLSACGSSSSDSTGSSEAVTAVKAQATAPEGLVKAGTLTVCIDPEYAPLEYYENGTSGDIIGFDADAARALAAYWGLEFATQVTTFEGLQPGLTSKRCDVIPGGLYMSEERTSVLDGVAYMQTGPALIVGTSVKTDPAAEKDLCGLTLVGQNASENLTEAKRIASECEAAGAAKTSVQNYPKTSDTVLAVMNGKADALIETDVAAVDIVKKSSGKLRQINGFFPPSTQFGMFANKDAALTAPLGEALKALYTDGTLGKIATTYGLSTDSLNVY